MSTATAEPTPAQTVAKTVAEVAPKLAIAAKVVALDDMRRQLRDHAARVADAHRMGAKALGMEDLVKEPEGSDEVGHLIVTGDINVSDPASLQTAMSALSGQPQQTSPPPATSEATPPNVAPALAGAGSLLKTALISAALIALPSVGVAIPWLAGAFDHPEPAAVVVDTDTDTQTSWAPAATN